MSAERAFQAIVRACVGHLKANERAVVQTRAPEAVHQMRVALRRWRTALSVFKDLLEDRGEAIRSELKWLAGELNEARDLDVFASDSLATAAPPGDHPDGLAALNEAASRARRRAYDRAAAAIRSERYRKLMWDGARAIESPGWTVGGAPSMPPARDLARSALKRRSRAVRRRGVRLQKLGPHARHVLRIDAKKARYTAELFSTLFDHPTRKRRFVGALKALQDSLGELNDIKVGRDLVRRLADDAGTPEALAAARQIANARAGGEARRLKAAEKAYDRFAGAEPFW